MILVHKIVQAVTSDYAPPRINVVIPGVSNRLATLTKNPGFGICAVKFTAQQHMPLSALTVTDWADEI